MAMLCRLRWWFAQRFLPIAIGSLASTGSSSDLDLFPSRTLEKQSKLRSAINCFELETVVFDSCDVDKPIARGCCASGSVRAMSRADDAIGWLAMVDQFFSDLDRAFGCMKKGWLALGLGLKPISGPSGFKIPKHFKPSKPFKPFKSRYFMRPLKASLEPSKVADLVHGEGNDDSAS
jgi:hypothetical protein